MRLYLLLLFLFINNVYCFGDTIFFNSNQEEEDDTNIEEEYIDNRHRLFFRMGAGFSTFILFRQNNYNITENSYRTDNFVVPVISVGYDIPISEKNAIVFELGFRVSNPSSKIFFDDTNTSFVDGFLGTLNFEYSNLDISIPILYRFNINQKFNFYAGISNNFSINTRTKFRAMGKMNNGDDIDTNFSFVNPSFNKYDIGLIIGYSRRISESNFLVDLRVGMGLISLMNHHESKNITDRINFNVFNGQRNLRIMLGVIYDIKFGVQKRIVEKIEVSDEQIFLNDE